MITNDKKTNYKNISEIEKIVDGLILKNKEKLKQTNLKPIDSKKFSSFHNKNKSIFYLKKIKNNKEDEIEKFSAEIIARARNNLGEKSVNKKFYEKTPKLEIQQKIHFSKPKINLIIGRKNKVDENINKIQRIY